MAVKTFGTEVLTSADTNTYLANSGLVYVTTATIGTGVTSVTLNNIFTSAYSDYRIIVSGGTQSGVGAVLTANLTASGTASTGSYYATFVFSAYSGSTITVLNTNNGTNWPYLGMSIDEGWSGSFDVLSPQLAAKTSFGGFSNRNDISGTISGFHNVSTAYDGISFTCSPGTMTGGTVTVYGYRKA